MVLAIKFSVSMSGSIGLPGVGLLWVELSELTVLRRKPIPDVAVVLALERACPKMPLGERPLGRGELLVREDG